MFEGFRSLFRKESSKKPELSDAEKEAQVASRRNFLKGIGAIGAVAAVEKLVPTAEAAEKKLTANPEIERVKPTEKNAEKHEQETFKQAYRELKQFSKENKLNHSDHHARPTAEWDALHLHFNERFKDSIVNTLLLAKKLNHSAEIQNIYAILKECNALGHYYKFVAELPAEEQEKMAVNLEWNFDRFQSQASDYLPTGSQVHNSEIDPRLLQITTQYDDGELLFPEGPRVSVEKTIQYHPGWTDPERIKHFRAILDDQNVRDLFTNSDCSLAEVYSIIKAAIKTEVPENQAFAPVMIIQSLLAEREAFKTKEILGPNTDTFIHFTLNDSDIDPEVAKQLAALATIWNKGEKSVVHKIKNDSERGLQKSSFVEGAPDPIIADLGLAIEKSQGNTLIYLHTHGSNEALGLHQHDNENILSTTELAKCLLRLVDAAQNPRALEKVTLLDSICHNYDFTQKLAADLRAQYSGNPSELALPTVITSAQEGSMAYTYGFAGETLKKFLPAIAKEKALTGNFLMRRVQPEAYLFGDPTFFTTKENGQWQEIGENNSKTQTTQTV